MYGNGLNTSPQGRSLGYIDTAKHCEKIKMTISLTIEHCKGSTKGLNWSY